VILGRDDARLFARPMVAPRVRVSGFGFRVSGAGFQVSDLVSGVGARV